MLLGRRLTARVLASHLPRRTLRLRLTLLYGGLFVVSGAALLTITYALVSRVQMSTGRRAYAQFGPSAGQVESAHPGAVGSVVSIVSSSQRIIDLQTLRLMSLLALAIMAAASMWLGWVIAGRVLRPLRMITTAARDISATNLHRRLALTGPDDELKELADTFDGLLARLETSFESQRRFVANASHELRTPLTRLKTVVQVALADPTADMESLRAAHERVLASEEQLEQLIDSLLTLASGEQAVRREEPLDLATVTAEVLGARAAEIERRDLQLDQTLDGAGAAGAPPLVDRLVENLIDNAILHNTPGGRIEVMTTTRSGRGVLRVSNTGAVIPAGELARISQPFQRLGTERTNHGGGYGLGLSIVYAIATAHEATVDIRARAGGGLTVEVVFPRPALRPEPVAALER